MASESQPFLADSKEGGGKRSIDAFMRSEGLSKHVQAFADLEIKLDSLLAIKDWAVVESIGAKIGMQFGDTLRLYQAIQAEREGGFNREFARGDGAVVSAEGGGNEEQYEHTDKPRKTCCGCYSVLFNVKEFFIPYAITREYRLRMARGLSGERLSEAVRSTCNRNVLIYSLLFNAVMSIWHLLPEDLYHDWHRTVWEAVMLFSTSGTLAVIIIFATYEESWSLVVPSNARAFYLSSIETLIYGEALGHTVFFVIAVSLMYAGFHRMCVYAPSVPEYAAYIVVVCSMVIFSSFDQYVNAASHIAIDGELHVDRRLKRPKRIGQQPIDCFSNEEQRIVDDVIIRTADAHDKRDY